jgi:TATA-box binding protein (TBP) (component of TFIID and TFIIIB)
MVRITNIVAQCSFSQSLDFEEIKRFWTVKQGLCGLVMKHPDMKPTLLIFKKCLRLTGCRTIEEAQKCMIRFGNMLGRPFEKGDIKIVTMSGFQKLANKVNLNNYNYQPELSNNASYKYKGMSFLIHHAGSVLIVGIKNWHDLVEAIMELESSSSL